MGRAGSQACNEGIQIRNTLIQKLRSAVQVLGRLSGVQYTYSGIYEAGTQVMLCEFSGGASTQMCAADPQVWSSDTVQVLNYRDQKLRCAEQFLSCVV